MKLSDKIRMLRKDAGLSQEQMGDKLNVSRQAITKWETGTGVPDIYNLVALSSLFSISLDDLVAEEKAVISKRFLYESRTEYDIEGPCDFDFDLHAAASLLIRSCDSEKLRIYAGSSEIPDLEKMLKIRIDNAGHDCSVNMCTKLSEARCMRSLVLEIMLPGRYVRHLEITAKTGNLSLKDIACDEVEVDARVEELSLDGVRGRVDITNSSDMLVRCMTLEGDLSVNQTSAVSRVVLPDGVSVRTRCRGIRNSFLSESPALVSADAPYEIELNGFHTELTLCKNQ